MTDSKNETAWIKVFEKYKIIENIITDGYFVINAKDINEFREARLMTKFDYKSQLPCLFSRHNLSILPVSRGAYIISNFETFHDFEANEDDVIKIDFPDYLKSIDYKNITSESAALNCAYVSGIIDHFTKDEDLRPTINGRMSSLSFCFTINAENRLIKIAVENSQIEIDGGYEGLNTLNIIEAKNSISKDFIIRQLYYPFRLWSNKVKKIVRPLFLTYTNGIFHLREYVFEDPNHYNSLRLLRQQKYAIRESSISSEAINKLLKNTRIIDEPLIPFPQADSFERVINLCELLNQELELSKETITENYDFDQRQTNYYTDAGRYLGLIDKKKETFNTIYYLTSKGNELFELSIIDRQLEFVRLILSHFVFNRALSHYFEKGHLPDRDEIVAIMKNSSLYKIASDSTFHRRASTISSWINWILGLIED